jgi:hypothetical protein
MMGWAWILAAAASLWCIRSPADSDASRSRWLPLIAPLLFAGLALLSVDARTTFALFTLEGFAVPDPGESGVALYLDGVRAQEDVRPASLRGPVLTAEVLDTESFEDAAGAPRPVALRTAENGLAIDAARSPRAMVGFDRFDLTRVHPLETVRSVALLDARGEIVREWSIEPARRARGNDTGDATGEDTRGETPRAGYRLTSPAGFDCDLSGDALAWDVPGMGALQRAIGQTQLRTIALLDLYWYQPTGCMPRRIELSDTMWPTTASNGDIRTPIRSFFILDGVDHGYLALLDPSDRVRVTFADAPATSAASATGAGSGETRTTLRADGERHRIHVLAPRIRIPIEQLKLEALSEGASDEQPKRAYCEKGYGPSGDLSGRKLCKRIQVYLRRFTFDIERRPGKLWLSLTDAPVVTVEPYGDTDVPRAVLRSGGYLVDARAAGSDEARSAPFPLRFPVSLENTQAFLAEIEATTDGCSESGLGCFEVRSFRSDPATVPSGAVSRYGAEAGEEYLLRASLVGSLRWIACVLVGLFSLQIVFSTGAADARRSEPLDAVTRAVLSALFVLLTARALFGFKLMVRYPHSAEGLSTALLGAAFLGAALCAVSYAQTLRHALTCAALLATGLASTAWLWREGTVPLPFEDDPRLIALVPGFLAVTCGLCIVATRGTQWIDRVAPGLAAGLLGGAATLRMTFAFLGAERLVVPFFAIYWPTVCLTGGLALYAFARSGSPIWLPASLLAYAVLAQWNDLGAVFVLAPPMLLACAATLPAVLTAGRSDTAITAPPHVESLAERHRARKAAAVASLLAGGALLFTSGFVDARIPPDPALVSWTIDEPGGDICPVPTGDEGELDLRAYASRFDPDALLSATSNRKARFFDLVRSGAANRIGTRAGTEVNEALAILRRYSAGPDPAFFGKGLLSADIRRYGRAEVDAQIIDGAPSVFVASEGGSAALIGLLLLQSTVLIAVCRAHAGGGRESLHLTFIAICAAAVPTWATFLMVGGNLHWLPFTGQNTPLLAMISGADLVATPFLWALALFATRLRHRPEPRHA